MPEPDVHSHPTEAADDPLVSQGGPMTRLAALSAALVLLAGSGAGAASSRSASASDSGSHAADVRTTVSAVPKTATHYSPPVSPIRLARGFEPPPTPYSAGHRGADLVTGAGAVVRTAGLGQISFAGLVAGRGVVVIDHADGVSTEYEPVTPSVAKGDAVQPGQPIGRVHGTHGTCAANGCLHWGAKRNGDYFDPLTLLRPLGPVRLLPWT